MLSKLKTTESIQILTQSLLLISNFSSIAAYLVKARRAHECESRPPKDPKGDSIVNAACRAVHKRILTALLVTNLITTN